MTGKLRTDAVSTQMAEAGAEKHRVVPGVTPAQGLQRRSDACASGLGDVYEEKIVFDGKQHGVNRSVLNSGWR